MRPRSPREWLFRLYAHCGRDPIPPRSLNFVGGEEFEALGRGHFENVRAIADLKPDDRVLDIWDAGSAESRSTLRAAAAGRDDDA